MSKGHVLSADQSAHAAALSKSRPADRAAQYIVEPGSDRVTFQEAPEESCFQRPWKVCCSLAREIFVFQNRARCLVIVSPGLWACLACCTP